MVPSPVQLVRVTEGVAVVPLVITGVLQGPPPELLTVISPSVKLMVEAPETVTGKTKLVELFPEVGEAVPTETVGAVLSTVIALEAAEAALGLLDASSAIPAPTVIDTSPSPVQLVRVTEGVAVVPLLITGVSQGPPPELLTVISPAVRLTVEEPVMATEKTKLVESLPVEGVTPDTDTSGPALAIEIAPESAGAVLEFPASSVATPDAIEIVREPVPAQPLSSTVAEFEVTPLTAVVSQGPPPESLTDISPLVRRTLSAPDIVMGKLKVVA